MPLLETDGHQADSSSLLLTSRVREILSYPRLLDRHVVRNDSRQARERQADPASQLQDADK